MIKEITDVKRYVYKPMLQDQVKIACNRCCNRYKTKLYLTKIFV